jgi:hypothetical protein
LRFESQTNETEKSPKHPISLITESTFSFPESYHEIVIQPSTFIPKRNQSHGISRKPSESPQKLTFESTLTVFETPLKPEISEVFLPKSPGIDSPPSEEPLSSEGEDSQSFSHPTEIDPNLETPAKHHSAIRPPIVRPKRLAITEFESPTGRQEFETPYDPTNVRPLRQSRAFGAAPLRPHPATFTADKVAKTPLAKRMEGLVQNPNQLKEKFLQAESADEPRDILETERNRPHSVWGRQLRSTNEYQSPRSSPMGIPHPNRLLRHENPRPIATQKPVGGPEITTPKQTTVRFL